MSTIERHKIPVGAYFYPLTIKDKVRQKRACELGASLVDETKLIQEAEPLFPGHDMPRVHCLGDAKITTWDDTEPSAMAMQAELANSHGIKFWVFDTFVGSLNGAPVRELTKPLDQAFLKVKESDGMKFAIMAVMGRPRVVLPMPKVESYEEPGRYYR